MSVNHSYREVKPAKSDLQVFGEEVLREQRAKRRIHQKTMAGMIGVTQSQISRIENGLSIPKDRQTFQRFVEYYKLSPEQADTWRKHIESYAPHLAFATPPSLEIYTEIVQNVLAVGRQGNPDLAIAQVDEYAGVLRRFVANGSYSERTQSAYLLGLLLQGKMQWLCHTQFSPVVLDTVRSTFNELQSLFQVHRDKNLFGKGCDKLGLVYYLDQNYVEAVKNFSLAITLLTDLDALVLAWRNMGVSYAYLNCVEKFKQVEAEIQRLLEGDYILKPETRCIGYEGLCRAQTILKRLDAQKTLENGWLWYGQLHTSKDKSPFRGVQMMRAELEVAKTFQFDDASIDTKCGNFIFLAHELGYMRHAKILEGLLHR